MQQKISLQEAIEKAKANPTSEFARSLRAKIETGELDGAAAMQDLTLPGQEMRETQSTLGNNNIYSSPTPPKRGILGKVRDFAVDVVGGRGLAEGAGQALATSDSMFAKGVRGATSFVQGDGWDTKGIADLSREAMERTQAQQDDLIAAIREARAAGEDTTRLERALRLNQASMKDAARIQTDFTSDENMVSNKKVIGDSVRLGATFALPKVTGGISKVMGGTKAATTLGAVAKGAKVGAVTGAVEGAVHGGAQAYGDDKEVLPGAAFGAMTGAAGGAVLGGAINGIAHKVSQGKLNASMREELKKQVSRSQIDDATLNKARTSVKNSLAFPVDDAIKAGDIAPDAVYKDQLAKTLTPEFAQGRIDDVAQKLSAVDESLADDFLSKIDINNTTYDEIVEAGLETLDEVKANPYKLDNVLMKAEKADDGKITIVKDKAAKAAVKEGIPEYDVALVKGAKDRNPQAVTKMFDTVEDAVNNPRTAKSRPVDVVGDAITERYRHVASKMDDVGKELDTVAMSLKGQTADFDAPINSFIDDLQKAGVEVIDEGGNFTLDFSNSDFKRAGKPTQRFLQEQLDDLALMGDDAYKGHQIKRSIDNAVDYGKSSNKGLVRQAENIVKKLRSNVDGVLDNTFTDYNRVNTDYATLRGALNDIDNYLGKSFNPNTKAGTTEAAQMARGLFSNRGKRGAIELAINNLQDVANTYDGEFNDDVMELVGVTEMLEDMFGTQAVTSLQGQTQRGVEQGALSFAQRLKKAQGLGDLALEAAGDIIESASPKGSQAVYTQNMEKLALLRALLE